MLSYEQQRRLSQLAARLNGTPYYEKPKLDPLTRQSKVRYYDDAHRRQLPVWLYLFHHGPMIEIELCKILNFFDF